MTENCGKLRESERKLRESEERYRTIIETTDTGFAVTDDKGLVLDANQKFVHLTGHQDLTEIFNRSIVEWTAANDKEKSILAIRRCIRDGFICNLEVDYVDSTGRITPIEINSTLVKTGPVIRLLSLCRDISDRIQVIANSIKFGRDYQDMGIKLPRWQCVNHVFLYAISHLDFLQIIRHVDLEVLEIYADPLLEKVLFNLMDNVIRHGVWATEVTLRYLERTDDLVLIIEDNGIGIPKKKKNLLFERGFGKDNSLGLSLVREILSITGITITETGVEGIGARFKILMPASAYRFSQDSDR